MEEIRLFRATIQYIILSIIPAIFMILTPSLTRSTIAASYHTSPGLSDPSIVPANGIFELTLAEQIDYGTQSNFFAITLFVTFTSPSAAQTTVHGFYYETLNSGTSLWKARFSPSEIGTYSYSYTLTHAGRSIRSSGTGFFQVVPGNNPGFIRQNPSNPFRWEFPNGEPFYPIGFNGGGGLNDVTNTDGGDRFGAFVGGRVINCDEHFSMFSNAGFNMIRFSQDNGAIPRLATNAAGAEGYDVYDETAAFYHDWYMQKLRSHNFRIFYGLFGFEDYMENPPSPERLAFVRYAVDRWAAYVDIWQIFNEETAPDDQWLVTIANEIRARDPYNHPITTSWHDAAGRVPEIEITAPHRYLHEGELTSDQVAAGWASFKSWGKPIILGEQGNSDMNWLSDSAMRMRIRGWTAFFREVGIIFWQTSWATNGMGQGIQGSGARNIYLGYEERQYNHIMMWFVNQVLKSDSVEASVIVSNRNLMRAYGLSSSDGFAAYIHHYANHTNTVSGQTITFGMTQAGEGYWIDPATGQLLGIVDVSARSNTLTIPDFVVDIAFFSSASLEDTRPIAHVIIDNPQADGDLDDDGAIDYGPFIMPFGMPPLTLNFDASDSYDLDGGQVSFSWDYGDGSVIENAASVSHTYTDGDYLTTLTVTDDEGNVAQHGFVVRATADPNPNQNDPPVFQLATNSITVREGEPIIVSVSASDSELEAGQYLNSNDILTYSASNLPPGAVFGTWGVDWIKQFFWLPDFDQAGVYHVQFNVQDAQGASATPQTLTINVLDVPAY